MHEVGIAHAILVVNGWVDLQLPRGQKEPRSSRGEGEHGDRSNGAHRSQTASHANGGSHERGHRSKEETRKPKLKSRVIAPE